MKIQLEIGGQQHEVDLTEHLPEGTQILQPGETPQGYVATDYMRSEIERRVKGAKSGLTRKEDLLADEAFRREFAEQIGVALDGEGKPVKAGEVDVKALHEQWKAQHLRPVEQQIEKLQQETEAERKLAGGLIDRMIGDELNLAAEELGFSKAMRTRPDKGTPSAVEAMFRGRLAFDRETGSIAVKNSDGTGFEYGPNPQERQWMSAKDLLSPLQTNPAYRGMFEAPQAHATGLGSAAQSGPGKVWSRQEIKSLSPEQFAKHADDINRAMAEGRVK